MSERITKPRHAITLRTYGELEQFAEAFGAGKLNLLILVGAAGIAKSQTLRGVVGRRAFWVEGNATAFGIYQGLCEHRDSPVVIDDVDSLYSDPGAVRLLKCLCQTDPMKRLAWYSGAAGTAASGGIPREFETTSRVCIIANQWKELNANVAAVQDRGHVVFFEPTPEEVHVKTSEWFWDQEVFDWFAEYLHLIPEPSMRHYVRAAELKAAGLDWVKVMLSDAVPEKALLVAKLRADASYREERERVEAFKRLGGGGQTTYYKWSKRIRAPVGSELSKIELPNARSAERPTLRVVREDVG